MAEAMEHRVAPGTFEDAPHDAALRLSVAIRTLDVQNRRMRAEMARLVRLSDNEFGAIAYLSEVVGATPKSLARELGLTTGAVTALIDRLEAAGLVARRRHPQDRRSTVLGLTPAGASLRDWIYTTYRSAITEATAVCGDASAHAAIEILLAAASAIATATTRLDRDAMGVPEPR